MMFRKNSHHYIENFHALNDVLQLNNILKLNRGAEVGVRFGMTSHYLLAENPALRMVLVDPFAAYQDVGDYFYQQAEQDNIKQLAIKRLTAYEDRVKWHFTPSTEAAKAIENESLDFVFIDANHAYECVRVDVDAWAAKVRSGGLVCGHDYNMEGVRKAVDEHAAGRHVTHIGWPSHVWVVEKG